MSEALSHFQQVADTEYGLAKPPAGHALDVRPLCHPRREFYADSLCKECFDVRDFMLSGQLPEGADTSMAAKLRRMMRSAEFVEGLARAAATMQANMAGFAKVAKMILETGLPEYAQLHMQAARAAAEEGDSKPMEWALTHLKPGGQSVVEPVAKAPSNASERVQVMIGVQLGNVPTGAVTATVVEIPKETA